MSPTSITSTSFPLPEVWRDEIIQMPRNWVLPTTVHWQEYDLKTGWFEKKQGAFFAQACMDIYQREPGVSIYMFVYGYKGKDSKVGDASNYSFYFWADRRTNGNVEATLRKVRASAFSFWNSIFIRQPPPSKLISQAALKIQSHQAFLSWSRGLTAKLPFTDASKTSKTSQRQIFIKVTKEHTILCFHIFWGQNIPLRTWKP